jgi:hypothetical protein
MSLPYVIVDVSADTPLWGTSWPCPMTAEGEAGVPVGTPCREQQCRCGCLDHERGDDRKAGHGQTLPRARDRQPQDGLDVAQAECAGDDGKDHEDAGYDSDADGGTEHAMEVMVDDRDASDADRAERGARCHQGVWQPVTTQVNESG